MTIEEQLKAEILSQYKSVRAFTTLINIPYTTLDSVFRRGIGKAGIDTMIKVFDALDLDIESISSGVLKKKKSPVLAKPKTEDLKLDDFTDKDLDALRYFFYARGIEEGQRLTSDQRKALRAIISLIDVVFPRNVSSKIDTNDVSSG